MQSYQASDDILRRLERGLTAIAIEFGKLHQARADADEPSEVKLSIEAIGTEMQRMHFFLTELQDAEQRGHDHGRRENSGAHR